MSNVLARAIGETDDIPYKIGLCDLCAMKDVDNLVDRLCVSVPQIGDDRFLRALGRIARFIHKEEAATVLMARIMRAQGKNRDRLIYALGATSTRSALRALLRMQTSQRDRNAVDAALLAHGAPRALEAVKTKRPEERSRK
jgi:hypothetical protein